MNRLDPAPGCHPAADHAGRRQRRNARPDLFLPAVAARHPGQVSDYMQFIEDTVRPALEVVPGSLGSPLRWAAGAANRCSRSCSIPTAPHSWASTCRRPPNGWGRPMMSVAALSSGQAPVHPALHRQVRAGGAVRLRARLARWPASETRRYRRHPGDPRRAGPDHQPERQPGDRHPYRKKRCQRLEALNTVKGIVEELNAGELQQRGW